MDQTQEKVEFLDVHELLEGSASSHGHHSWFWYAAGLFLLIVMISTYVGMDHPGLVQAASLVGMMNHPHDFAVDPLPNVLFTRASSVWIADRVAISSLTMPARFTPTLTTTPRRTQMQTIRS